MSQVDDYLESVTPSQRKEFERVRKIVKQLVPDAEELISYGVPTFKYKGRPVIYWAAFKNHMSVYPASDELVEVLGETASKFRTGKGTLQFTEDNPLPDIVIETMVQLRLNAIG